jgi:hypothetical protein
MHICGLVPSERMVREGICARPGAVTDWLRDCWRHNCVLPLEIPAAAMNPLQPDLSLDPPANVPILPVFE